MTNQRRKNERTEKTNKNCFYGVLKIVVCLIVHSAQKVEREPVYAAKAVVQCNDNNFTQQ